MESFYVLLLITLAHIASVSTRNCGPEVLEYNSGQRPQDGRSGFFHAHWLIKATRKIEKWQLVFTTNKRIKELKVFEAKSVPQTATNTYMIKSNRNTHIINKGRTLKVGFEVRYFGRKPKILSALLKSWSLDEDLILCQPVMPTTQPATTAMPEPATTAMPEPATTALPEPATTALPEPATTALPEPATTAVPEPATTALPEPATTALPEPATTTVPEPATTAVPEPATTSLPEPATTALPEPETTAAPEPATTAAPAPATTGMPQGTENDQGAQNESAVNGEEKEVKVLNDLKGLHKIMQNLMDMMKNI